MPAGHFQAFEIFAGLIDLPHSYLEGMGLKYAIRDPNGIYFLTFTVIDWIDLFTRDEYRRIFIDSLKYCQENKGLSVHAYCIMTSHVHLILSARPGYDLRGIVRDIKRYTSIRLKNAVALNPGESRRLWILQLMGYRGYGNSRNLLSQVWKKNNQPIELTTEKITHNVLEYIHMNPVAAGFVDDPNIWTWSSCACYELNREGMLELEYLF